MYRLFQRFVLTPFAPSWPRKLASAPGSHTVTRVTRSRLLAGAALVVTGTFAAAGCSPAYLYSPSAGFSRVSPITVRAAGSEAALAISWWNTLAGRELFALTTGPAQVTIQNDAGFCGPTTAERVACTQALPTSGVFSDPPIYPYSSCHVYVSSAGAAYWQVYAHELGHCLGFEHVTDRESIMNPHPIANDAWDQSMLVAAGYR